MGGVVTAKDVAKWAGENLPPELIAILVFLGIAVMITWKISSLVAATTAAYEKHEARFKAVEERQEKDRKQRHKLEQLISAAPCISKVNGLWLQDEARNGGQPPEAIQCKYEDAKRKVIP